MKILIVDDTRLSRLMINKRLPADIKETASIIEGTNGEEAVTLFIEHSPDITFLDLTMPVMDGFDALALMKAHNREAVIYVVTADVQAKSVERVMSLGATALETKPISEERLSDIFSSLKKL